MSGHRPAISGRSLGLGLAGAVALAVLTPYNDYYLRNTYIVGNHFPIGVVFVMGVLTLGVNTAVRAWRPTAALCPGELVVILAMLWVAGSVPGSGLMRYWPGMLVGPFYFATDAPHWHKSLALVPAWWVPSKDPESPVVTAFYLGLEAGAAVPWGAWVGPFLGWSVFFVSTFVGVFCLAAILRRPWVEQERLAFPLAQIPLEMIRPPAPGRLLNALYADRRFWIGASLAVGLLGLKGLHQYFPEVPVIPTEYDISGAFTSFPWDWMPGWITHGTVYVSCVAVAYFLSTEVSFSLWFFSLAWGFVYVLCRRLGLSHPGPSAVDLQIGAYLAAGATILWVARRHLWAVWRAAWRPGRLQPDDYLPARWAVLGLVAAVVGGVGWLMYSGAGLGGAVLSVLLLYLVYMVVAKVVAESGLLFVQSSWAANQVLTLTPAAYSHATFLTTMVTHRIMAHDLRECLMPFVANSLRLADGDPTLHRRRFLGVLLATVLLAMVAAAWAHGRLTYAHGAQQLDPYSMLGVPRYAFNEIAYFDTPLVHRQAQGRLGHVGLGAGLLALLAFLRRRLAAWPLHPIGYLMANTYAMSCLWFSFLLGWTVKALVLRYGRAAGYNRYRPFFIGLILGEATIGTVWMVVMWILGPAGKAIRLLPG